jgi:hypothetical protein
MAGATVLSSDLSALCGARKDQGLSSACTTHSLTSGLSCAQTAAPLPAPVLDGSPQFLYVLSGRVERPTGALQDDGREPVDVLTAFRESGVRPQTGPTPDGRNSDIWTPADVNGIAGAPPANACQDATPDEIAAAQLRDYDVGNHVIPPGDGAPALVIAALTATPPAPVWVAATVGQTYQNLVPGQVAPAPDPNDPTDGGHMQLIVGHRPAVSGAPGDSDFLVVNSWGPRWDEAGEAWVCSDWVRAALELYPLTFTLKGPDAHKLSLVERIERAVRGLLSELGGGS